MASEPMQSDTSAEHIQRIEACEAEVEARDRDVSAALAAVHRAKAALHEAQKHREDAVQLLRDAIRRNPTQLRMFHEPAPSGHCSGASAVKTPPGGASEPIERPADEQPIHANETLTLRHTRYGRLRVRVDGVDGMWLRLELLEANPKAGSVGEIITVRRNLCVISKVPF